MPTAKQVTVEAPVTERFMGRADTNGLKQIFAASPIHTEELTDEERRQVWQTEVLDGPINDGGHTFGVFEPNYLQAPDPAAEVETGGGGLPASAFVPNPASPGPGSINAADMPEYAGELPDPEFNIEFGSGLGGLISPSQTSAEISKQGTLGAYISGRSFQGSDGKA